MRVMVEAQLSDIDKQKRDLVDQLNAELAKHKLMMGEIVEGAKG